MLMLAFVSRVQVMNKRERTTMADPMTEKKKNDVAKIGAKIFTNNDKKQQFKVINQIAKWKECDAPSNIIDGQHNKE